MRLLRAPFLQCRPVNSNQNEIFAGSEKAQLGRQSSFGWVGQEGVFTEMRSYFEVAIVMAIITPAILSARSDDIPNLDVRPVSRGIASQSASNPGDVRY